MNPLLIPELIPLWIMSAIILLVLLVQILRSIRIVPAQTVLVVERLGKYSRTLGAGIHLLVPFMERVKYVHTLKEQVIDVPKQPAITRDNVRIEIDGVLYLKLMDPVKASYGIEDYHYATIQLAQTTMRSVIGQLELDKTFEEREAINAAIVRGISDATEPWGVQIVRYEIQNIHVPQSILEAMEIQMKAEREKRAVVAQSEGEMESRINHSLGVMEELIQKSEGEKQARINEADGKAVEIRALAKATAESIRSLAGAVTREGGEDAVLLQISQQYVEELSQLARKETSLVLPLNLGDLTQVLESLTRAVREE
ncbi:band 7 protein [Spirochaeta thermophila DSM 6578]|uniref:Band 7 protein n=1 Tax=Winmispira thermophila (strain ATCC 700085 / DSM 6578 / Z-1203) TaxID=869211 RepID=G0GG41_WINT7|nr:stomatin-like protein [Spirochaeta thermophila]AEJ62517.1 band 7 protein [Spirochaeta thermophila DSM 6578]